MRMTATGGNAKGRCGQTQAAWRTRLMGTVDCGNRGVGLSRVRGG